MGIGVLHRESIGRGVGLTIHFHLVLKLRMSGAIFLSPPPPQLYIQCNICIAISFWALRPHQITLRTQNTSTKNVVSWQFSAGSQISEKRLLASSRLSAWNSAPTRQIFIKVDI